MGSPWHDGAARSGDCLAGALGLPVGDGERAGRAIVPRPAVTTGALARRAPGPYVLTPGGGHAANYRFTFVSGVLTITPAAQTLTFPPLVRQAFHARMDVRAARGRVYSAVDAGPQRVSRDAAQIARDFPSRPWTPPPGGDPGGTNFNAIVEKSKAILDGKPLPPEPALEKK